MNPIKYLLPRLALLGMLLIGIWVSAELITRTAINHTQLLQPLEVSVDQASIQWKDRTVLLRNLQLGTQDSPDALRADKLTLKLDESALLDKRWVVVDGILTNPAVGPRGSESVDAAPGLAARLESALIAATKETDGYNSRSRLSIEPTWLQQIRSASTNSTAAGSHTLQALEGLKAKWESQLLECRQKIKVLQEQIFTAQNIVEHPVNPLRSNARLSATQRVNELNQQILELQTQIEQIYKRADAELATVMTTAEGEIRQLESSLRLPMPSAEGYDFNFSAHQPSETIQQLLQWAEWAAAVVPHPHSQTTSGHSQPGRGRNVSFGREIVPSLEIQKLTMVGVTDVGGQYYRLIGSLNNLSNLAYAQRYPTQLSVRAQGQNHVIVNGVYDRRAGADKSYVSIKSLDLNRADSLELLASANDRVGLPLQVAPNSYSAQFNLNLDGAKLSGRLVIRHSGMKVHCDPQLLGDGELAQRVTQELAEIADCEVVFHLSGTVDQLVVTAHSDFGQKVAAALGNSTQEHFEGQVNRQMLATKNIIETNQRSVTGWLEHEIRTLQVALHSEQERVANLQTQPASNSGLRLR